MPELSILSLVSPILTIDIGSDTEQASYTITGDDRFAVGYLGVVPAEEQIEEGYAGPFLQVLVDVVDQDEIPDGQYIADTPIRNVEISPDHLPYNFN